MNKQKLSERDICTKFITPAIVSAGWDLHSQIREELSFTKGRIIVRGKLHTRGKQKRADYVLYYKSNIPIAVIEAKENNLSVGAGMQQALDYAESLDVPFVFSSNGDAFLMHDRTGLADKVEQEISLESFPSPEELWERYCKWKGVNTPEAKNTVEMPYYDNGTGRSPRYYQISAVNRAIEAVASGANRILLVMALALEKLTQHFRLSGAFGNPAPKNAFCFWLTEIS